MKHFVLTLALFSLMTTLSAQDIVLPKPQTTGGKPLMEALQDRVTDRKIAEKPLSKEHLSNLLWAANGVNRADGRRTAPSASNNQEIEIYVFLAEGVYWYDYKNHSLVFKVKGDHRKEAARQGEPSGALLMYVADFGKMGRYDDAAKEFYSATDAGFVSQNVYLYCASEGLATVVLGMINRPVIMDLLGIQNGKVILGQPVGYKE